ncbi:MAG: PD40 domain-containing protein [Acidobacteria bacterium]|nr:PD40 domain-containing protein [Acidobacteriota bacterium]
MRTMLFQTLCFFLATLSGEGRPLLLQNPTVSRAHVVFQFAGDLWIAGREGGQAKRLTTGAGEETRPLFSPNGEWIAFTGEYDGNVDVYVVAAAGGVPKRLTYHPDADQAAGWTPDSKAVLFRSSRAVPARGSRLYTVPVEGGWPAELPLNQAYSGSYSSDQKRIAYMPLAPAFATWKMYRGGRATYLQIADLADSRGERIPRGASNDFNPMWIGNEVYFLSDRSGTVSLYRYNTQSKKVTLAVSGGGGDIKSASYGGDAVVYEQFGSLHLLDLKSGKARKLEITVNGDLPELRPKIVNAGSRVQNGSLSPSGARAVFNARGDIFTVPAEKGDPRNLTETPGVHERYPAWSPDGRSIACFSDESGEYALHIRNQNGAGEVKKIRMPESTFYLSPAWSPDSKKIAFHDQRLNYWYVDVKKAGPVKIDTDAFAESAQRTPVWSPDSRWLAYSKSLDNRLRAIMIYSVEDGKATEITDGMSDARHPVFDKNGKHLYFTASTDIGPSIGDGLATFRRAVTRSVYLAVLGKDLPSPLAPESDEEKAAAPPKPAGPAKPEGEATPAAAPKPPEKVTIDFENIGQRILALPIPPRDISALHAGKANTLFLVEAGTPAPGAFFGAGSVQKYDLEKRKLDKVLDAAGGFSVSHNGEKMLYSQGSRWFIASTAAPVKPGEGALRMERMEMRVDPVAEWSQMYREVWRYERDFFYDGGHHGYDLQAAAKQYEPYLAGVASRGDLNYLFTEMLREMRVSHLGIGGGDQPEVKRVRGGLLGADYKIENGRYRFAKVYNGENWNPQTRAPLTQPGVNVAAGEYLLGVNGRELRASDNLYAVFEGTADKSVVLRVGPNADGSGARNVTVVPVANEFSLRHLDWIEGNRRKVEQATGGKVAYVYLPDTAFGGYSNFNRYFYSQIGKKAVIFDERYNGGGALADYIVESAGRKLLSMGAQSGGKDFWVPHSIYGPRVMLINEYAGSGGDAMPYYFKELGLGPLIGKRTWGGLVRGGGPPGGLIDGGFVSTPNAGLYNGRGEWIGENKGIQPDIEVEDDPAAVRAGRDPQLEKAMEVVLKELEKNPYPEWKRPPFTRHDRGR